MFTSGATEAINAATFGAVAREGTRRIVATAVEHSAVLESSRRHDLVTVGVDDVGRVDPAAVLACVDEAPTALVHAQWANHEVGTRQPVAEVVAGCRDRGVLVHVDAAAAAGHDDIDFVALGADLLSVSAHKLGGPKGAGALLVRRGLRLDPFIVGGDQERARRGGLENVPACVGFGVAADARDTRRTCPWRSPTPWPPPPSSSTASARSATRTIASPTCCASASMASRPKPCSSGSTRRAIAAHSGSACSSEALEPSPVLLAMGVEAERSLRVSVGWSTTDDDVDAFAAAFPQVVDRLRRLAG